MAEPKPVVLVEHIQTQPSRLVPGHSITTITSITADSTTTTGSVDAVLINNNTESNDRVKMSGTLLTTNTPTVVNSEEELLDARGGLKVTISGANPVPQIVKKTKVSDIVPNPLNQFPSYSYAFSLWWVDVAEYNTLASTQDPDKASAWEFGPRSYVVAEDSGLYPTRRIPGTLGLNYYIKDVELRSTIAPTLSSGSSNLLEGSCLIVEPQGVTFIDQLVAASFDGTQFQNFTQQPYILQLEFKGYDNNGNPITLNNTYRKRFPIMITAMKVNVTGKGTEYKVSFKPINHESQSNEYNKLYKDINITGASTVEDFFKKFADQINSQALEENALRMNAIPDLIKFQIDPIIGKTSIVDSTKIPFASVDSAANNIKIDSTTINIPSGTKISTVITRIIAHSGYLISQIGEQVGGTVASGLGKKTQTDIFKAFKTTTAVTFNGSSVDKIRNTRAKTIEYIIRPYDTWKTQSPNLPQLSSSIDYTIKRYDYLYTGKNTDVIDLKINFDLSYYTTIIAYPDQVATQTTSKSTGFEAYKNSLPRIFITPSLLTSVLPEFGAIGSVTPSRIRAVKQDQNLTVGFGTIARPEAVKSADTIANGIYNGEQSFLSVDLTIVGDPTLLKQDDWYYIPNVSTGNYNKTDQFSQAEYAAKYGHFRSDTGELPVTLNINTPIDMDLDITNQGGVYPPPGVQRSLFSGQFIIKTVNSKFTGGKFTQVLGLSRYTNSDYMTTKPASGTERAAGVQNNSNGYLDDLGSAFDSSSVKP